MRKFHKKGMVGGVVGQVIGLIVGVGVAVLVLIFVGTMGGQTYNLAEPKISNISDSTIKTYVTDSVKSGFSALKQTGDYLPLIILAIVISLVLMLVLSYTMIGGGGGGNAL